MGCTDNKSDDDGNEEERPRGRRVKQRHNFNDDEEIDNDEEEFKDFEELGSKFYYK